MAKSTTPILAPSYLSLTTLPLASDIFYHSRIIYTLPTGFVPLEVHAVAGFPEYCKSRQIALPKIIWNMCDAYFRCAEVASKAADILRPLRKRHILIVAPIYSRDTEAIDEAKVLLRRDHELVNSILTA